MKKLYRTCFIVSFFFFIFALAKVAFYDYDINYYVGGDAYNLIINAGRATAYFVVSMGTLITGTLLWIFDKITTKEYYLNGEMGQNQITKEDIENIVSGLKNNTRNTDL